MEKENSNNSPSQNGDFIDDYQVKGKDVKTFEENEEKIEQRELPDLDTKFKGEAKEPEQEEADDESIKKDEEEDEGEDTVRIGGRDYTVSELEQEAGEFFGTDLSKKNPEEKDKFISAYVNTAHKKAMDKAYTQRNQSFAQEKQRIRQEYETKKQSILEQRTALLERIKDLDKIAAQDTDMIMDDDERVSAKIDQNLARKELENIKNTTLQEVECQYRQVVNEETKDSIETGINSLQARFPELKTSEDINEVYLKIKNNSPDVDEADALKVKYIVNLMRKAVKDNIDPLEEYEFDRYRFKDVFKAPGKKKPAKRAEDFSNLSLEERLKQLREKQKNTPGNPKEASKRERSQYLSGDKDTPKLKLKDLGY